MKHYYLKKAIILAIALLPFWLYGQATFKPVLTDGKSWEVARLSEILNYTEEIDTVDYYTISVLGDTLVNNQTCKKIEIVSQSEQNQNQILTAVAYEENGKVWNVRDDGEMELLFDIGIHQYDEFGVGGFVVAEDHIYVNGVDRKRLYVDSGVDADINFEDLYFYIVEGIGVSNNFWLSGQTGDIGPCVMLSCSENGETIFTKKDFRISSNSTVISSIEGDKYAQNVCYYNLLGVKSAIPFNGVNVKVTTYSDGTRKCEKVLQRSHMQEQ